MLESEDADAINSRAGELQTAFHAVSEAMYQRAQESAATGNGASADGAAGETASESEEEDVVDAEVVDEPKA